MRLAVVLVADAVLRIGQQFGLGMDVLAGGRGKGRVHIDPEIGDDVQVVP